MKTVAEALVEIERLTQDKDEQQELWICYLEEGGDNVEALSSYLAFIRKKFSEDQLLQVTLWTRVYNLEYVDRLRILDYFTELEQTVMRFLALGASLDEIEGITSLSSIRLKHVISVIRKQDVWKTIDGPET